MTAKEQLRERVRAFSEKEAREALSLLDLSTDPVIATFRDAPIDDEPWTRDDEAAATEGRADPGRNLRSLAPGHAYRD